MSYICLLAFCFLVAEAKSYFPVVCISGIGDSPPFQMQKCCNGIAKKHPGTKVEYVSLGNFIDGAKPLDQLIEKYTPKLEELADKYPDGVHIISYSLAVRYNGGGLIGRGLVQKISKLKVRLFFTINSPLLGVYPDGPCKGWACLETILLWQITSRTLDFVYKLFTGSDSSRHYIWHDHNLRHEYPKDFLPKINNLIPHPDYETYKQNILKIEKIYLIASNKDGVCVPWFSGLGAFYGPNYEMVPLEDQLIYKNDTLGLKQMNEEKRLERITVKNCGHIDIVLFSDIFHCTVTDKLY